MISDQNDLLSILERDTSASKVAVCYKDYDRSDNSHLTTYSIIHKRNKFSIINSDIIFAFDNECVDLSAKTKYLVNIKIKYFDIEIKKMKYGVLM